MADFIEDVLNGDNNKDKGKKRVQKARTTKTKVSLSKEEKLKAKFEKLKVKEAYKKTKREERKQRRLQGRENSAELLKALKDDSPEAKTKKEKIFKEESFKKVKKRRNASLYIREWPIKMLKETHKIKWASKKDVAVKFFWVILFIIVFGALFYFVDWGISTSFFYMKII